MCVFAREVENKRHKGLPAISRHQIQIEDEIVANPQGGGYGYEEHGKQK